MMLSSDPMMLSQCSSRHAPAKRTEPVVCRDDDDVVVEGDHVLATVHWCHGCASHPGAAIEEKKDGERRLGLGGTLW